MEPNENVASPREPVNTGYRKAWDPGTAVRNQFRSGSYTDSPYRSEFDMRAAVIEAFGEPLVIRVLDIGAPGTHEVLLRTAAVGLCHSDLHYMQGMRKFPLPGVLGH